MSRTGALLEELRKERMREELLVREIARKRMVEDEILRELEFERSLSARRFEEDRFLPLERGERCGLGVGEGSGSGLMQRSLKIGEYERSPSLPVVRGRNLEMDEWPAPWERAAGEFEKPTALPRSKVENIWLNKSKPEVSGYKNDKLLDHQTTGVKRKAASVLPRLAKKEWSCSLCHVTAPSQKVLNIHLRGKKHMAKEALLTNNEVISKKSNASSSMKQDDDVVAAGGPTKKMKTVNSDHDKWAKSVWCGLCGVKCNSPAMMDAHLKGKRHKTRLESKISYRVCTDSTTTAEVVKEEVTNQTAKEKDIQAEDNCKAIDQEAKKDGVKAKKSC